jgi:FlaA1/EpsC-like NDP-sugar epimerase
LVIGGAGTIGSSYIKAVLKFNPKKLFVIDTNENGLTELTRDLRSSSDIVMPEKFVTYPMNFGDPVFAKMFKNEGPFHIVANFAAHKHVRSEKDKYSVEAMIENNVIKAKSLLDLLVDFPPKKFFCVSTDKATNPVNVMGASKKLMEDLIMSYSEIIPITTARFANVAFSNGSLLFGYKERLAKGQPLSCPSDIKRFFVSPEESGQICMLACILGQSGNIFFPKLEESQMEYFKNITDRYIEALGYKLDLCSTEKEAKEKANNLSAESDAYPVYYFSTDTSGEKLYEEFYSDKDKVDLETFSSLGVIKNATIKPRAHVVDAIGMIEELLSRPEYDKNDIVKLINKFIPDFSHIETGKSLDDKM